MSDEQRSRGGDIAIARYVPPVSVPDMERMAHAIVQSGLFGVRTVPQALTLMWLAQAEGRHPVLAARDYHVIEGKPSKTAEAMMRDFLAARGTVEWHQLDDSAADATFAHPLGGEVRIKWDMERARKAGLLGRKGDMWAKYPRQMLRSRCVSEGIRTVGPMATSGLYVPEEVGDFEPRRPRMKDVTPPPAEPEPFDPETGEIMDTMADRARRMAGKGTEVLRNWLQDLSRDDRASLRELIGTADQPGALLTLARQADAEASHERLRHPMGAGVASGDTRSQGERTPQAREEAAPATDTPPSELTAQDAPAATEIPADGSPPQRSQTRPVAATGRTSAGHQNEPPPRSTFWEQDRLDVPLYQSNGGKDWQRYCNDFKFLNEEATAADLIKMRADSAHNLQQLKVARFDLYRDLIEEIERGRNGPPE